MYCILNLRIKFASWILVLNFKFYSLYMNTNNVFHFGFPFYISQNPKCKFLIFNNT